MGLPFTWVIWGGGVETSHGNENHVKIPSTLRYIIIWLIRVGKDKDDLGCGEEGGRVLAESQDSTGAVISVLVVLELTYLKTLEARVLILVLPGGQYCP